MTDLEEGELDNSEPEDEHCTGPTVYKMLERPVSSVPMSSGDQARSGFSYRSRTTHASSDSNTDEEDEDGDSGLWKNKQEKFFRKQQASMDTTSQPNGQLLAKPVKKVNNVWGSVLTEQDLTQTLAQSGSVDKASDVNYNERNVESYDYTKKYLDARPAVDTEQLMSGETHDPFEAVLKSVRGSGGRPVVAYEDAANDSGRRRGKKRKSDHNDRGGKSIHDRLGPKKVATITIADLDVNTEMEDAALIDKIADILNEPKKDLVERVVEHMGKEVAIRVLEFTRDVENGGGMLTFDGSRRRTAGGVYLQMIKQQPEFTKDVRKLVFKEEHERLQARRRERKKNKKKSRKSGDKSNSRSSSKGSRAGDQSGEEMEYGDKDETSKDNAHKNMDEGLENDNQKSKGHKSRRARRSFSRSSDSDSDDDRGASRKPVLSFEEELSDLKRLTAQKSKAAEMETGTGDDSKENIEDINDLDADVIDIPLDG